MSKEIESKEALKATGIVGGGQVINIVIGLVKTKVMAVLLGPSGVGIIGILSTAIDMIRNTASFGITFSGVRDISIAVANNDEKQVAKIVKVFNKWVLISAFLGAFIAIVLCLPLSRYLFKNDNYAFAIAFLSISIFFTAIGSGYAAVMQGKRAIPLMVKASVISNLISSLITIIIYLFFLEKGIVPSLIIIAIIGFVVNYFFYKKLNISKFESISFSESWHSAKDMIKIGLFTVIVSTFDQIMYLGLRAFISGKSGIESVGFYTAANTIATLYLSLVLSSIGSEYYPRLASINKDNVLLQKAVNSQLNIILLLASPFIIGMIGFTDIVIYLFYSNKFIDASDILKWHVIGDFFKIISWPCGFVFLAKGLGKIYTGYSISFTILYVVIIYFGWDYLGFFILGISFFVAQLVGTLFTYIYSFKKYNIYMDRENLKTILFFSIALILAFCCHKFIENPYQVVLSGLILVLTSVFSLYKLNSIIDVVSFLKKRLKIK